jgi:TonB-linked SusC/RagA family outer membrane protein
MRKMKLFFTALAVLMTSVAFAQNITVTGHVTDAQTNEAVPFAAVRLDGTMTGVSTDADGLYSISVPANGVLVFSSIGYENMSVAVEGRTRVNVSLNPDSEALDETIVVAYGVQKKSSFVGSAIQVSGEKLERMQTTNISKSLEGAVAGLQTASSSGTPGSGSSIIIRGLGSISASQSPLIVVDGVPYEGSLNSIPTQDIESLTVLKDAAANSMYGARGSNGVIIITTKRGAADKIHVTFDAKVGVNSRAVPAYDVITNPGDYYEMAWESLRNAAYYRDASPLTLAQANMYASAALIPNLNYNTYKGIADHELIDPATGKLNPAAKDLKWTDNWNRDVFENGLRQEYNVSASGGSDKTQAYFSASYLKDGGYVPMSGFTRLAVRSKVDHQVTKWLKAGLNVSYSNTNQQQYGGAASGSSYNNLFFFGQNIAPIYPIYQYDLATGERLYGAKGEDLYDWGEMRAFGQLSNPYGQLMTSLSETISDNMSSRGYVDIQILKDLKFSANVAYDVFNQKGDFYTTPAGGDAANVNGRGDQSVSRYTALNANQLLTYYPTWGDHSLNVLLGHETKSDVSYGLSAEMTNVVDPTVSDFDNFITYQGLSSATTEYFLQGFFGRAEYSYANKYTASASYRMDASSRFHPDRRWGSFWAVGASWNMKQEGFLAGVRAVDYLRLKASYGTQGNDNVGYTKVYEDLYTISRVDGEASVTKVFRAAPEVTWEKSNNFNAGFEARLFNRLTLNADFFIKETKDMIYSRPLAPSAGSPASQLVNDIDMKNTGIEFELAVDIIKNQNLVWNVSLNGTHYKNELTKLPSDKTDPTRYPDGYQSGSYWRKLGGSLYDFYLYEWAGVDDATGLPLYNKYEKDENGVETVTLVNTSSEGTLRQTGKSALPKFYGGFNTSLSTHGFDFSAAFAYQIGGYTMDSNYQSLMGAGRIGTNWHKDAFNRWTPDNTTSDVPRLQNAYQEASSTSTRWLTDASYISLRNLTVGYTFPKRIANRLSMQSLRIFATGDNLWYLSRRKGLDVRQSFSGATGFTYSALRTVSGGITVTF